MRPVLSLRLAFVTDDRSDRFGLATWRAATYRPTFFTLTIYGRVARNERGGSWVEFVDTRQIVPSPALRGRPFREREDGKIGQLFLDRCQRIILCQGLPRLAHDAIQALSGHAELPARLDRRLGAGDQALTLKSRMDSFC
jgi:hypothetical protein